VERSMVWAKGAAGVASAGGQSSPTSMPYSLLEEVSDSSLSEGGRALGCGGGTGLPCIPWKRHRGRRHSLGSGGGSGAAAGDWLGVAALGAGGFLASVGGTSMLKRTVGAGGVFLGASGRGVSKSLAVGPLGLAVSLRRFFRP